MQAEDVKLDPRVDVGAALEVMSPETMQRVLRRHDAVRRNLNGRGNDRFMRAGAPEPKLKAKRWTLDYLRAVYADLAARNAVGEFIPGQREGRRRIRLAIDRTRRAIAKCERALARAHAAKNATHRGGEATC